MKKKFDIMKFFSVIRILSAITIALIIIIFMANGVIEEIGTPDEIFNNPKSELTKAFLSKSLEDI